MVSRFIRILGSDNTTLCYLAPDCSQKRWQVGLRANRLALVLGFGSNWIFFEHGKRVGLSINIRNDTYKQQVDLKSDK